MKKIFHQEELMEAWNVPFSAQHTLESFMRGGSKHLETLNAKAEKRLKAPDGSIPRLCLNPGSKEVSKESRLGADILVPLDPLISGGGTISTGPSNFCVRNSKLTSSKELSFPIQESRRTAAATPRTTTPKMGEEEVGSKVPPLKEIKDEDVFLVLPSFAEPFSQNIKQIICHEKKKLCKIKKYNAIFSNTKIRLAFTNNKSVKKLIVRTKI